MMVTMSRCYVHVLVCWRDRAEQIGESGSLSEGKDEERAVAIPRFQGGSPRLCRLRIMSFWPRWQALICTDHISGFMGPGKHSSPATTLSNYATLL
jgi:hypothetical protein